MQGKVWLQDNRINTDAAVAGQRMISFFDGETNTIVTYYPHQNKAVRLASDSPEIKAELPTEYIKMIDYSKAQVLGTELYDGAPCRVILLPGENGGQTKMWLREDCGLPVKVEATAPGDGVTVTEYRNLRFGLPPGTFELPPGVEVVDINKVLE
ncbi:MAG: LolA family protein [Desulfotomaculales bacterium]